MDFKIIVNIDQFQNGDDTMTMSTYMSAFKSKIVLDVLQEESVLSIIASKYDLNPNMVRT